MGTGTYVLLTLLWSFPRCFGFQLLSLAHPAPSLRRLDARILGADHASQRVEPGYTASDGLVDQRLSNLFRLFIDEFVEGATQAFSATAGSRPSFGWCA